MDDHEIVALFLERSEQAITELSQKYGRTCQTIARNILSNTADAEECVNDAWLGVWNTVPPQSPDPLSAYVYRIVRNLAIKKYRANTAVKRNSFYDAALDELENCLPTPHSVEDTLDAAALSVALDEFLAILSDDDRVMFLRRYWYSDPVSAIALRFGVNSHYVSVRLSRIREKLRKFLLKKGMTV